jgi:hypothetical protein
MFGVSGAVLGAVVILLPILLWIALRGARQNAGIVMEISVANGVFYWRKQTLWGSREYFWRVADLRRASAETLTNSLVVRRHRGPPLGAFSYVARHEVDEVIAAINRAIEIERARAAPVTAGDRA